MRKAKRIRVITMVLLLVLFSSTTISFASSDIGNHWAKEDIEYLLKKDIISGYSDDSFKPDKEVSRAEFIKMINNVFGFTKTVNLSFTDVKETDWFYKEIKKGVAAGYIEGYEDGTIRPNNKINREEASKIIATVFKLENSNEDSYKKFKDSNQISSWARAYVSLMLDKGYIKGYSDNTFGPKKNITRAEVAHIIRNASGEILNESKEYSLGEVKGNVIINKSNVTLNGTTIEGNLYLTEGIGTGDILLEGVNVKGTIYIEGTGKNKITLSKSKVNRIIANNADAIVGKDSKVEKLIINGKEVVETAKGKENTITTPSTSSGGSSGTSSSGGGGGSKEPEGPKNPEGPNKKPSIEAVFYPSPILNNFGRVSIKTLEEVSNAYKYEVKFKYSNGVDEDVVGPVNIDDKTSEIFYNGSFPVTINIYDNNGVLVYTFNNIELER
ncbi:S-layer homology domain-containing protein [Tissierella sp. MSJ-40]|uniref:S-layer homology domain-containing protein n=1 Tax=Tissierella simiarum TaxID=2841534 RepID=A0ABS6E246_9FIRM|nr:S-layer homology domain-containing protein [Tissierella simiarum]MBU5436972.1 S-layer homology domain-containing protein [Tissierella simiarum]